MATRREVLGTLSSVVFVGCLDGRSGSDETIDDSDGNAGDNTSLATSAFASGESIPPRFTCEGEDVSPPLAVESVPTGADSLALIVDDPDAPGTDPFVHWLLWNVPPGTTRISSGIPRTETVDSLGGAAQGTNDFDAVGYRGPCPPAGNGPHTYRFRLHVLDSMLSLDPGADRSAVEGAMAGHQVGDATLTGTFQR